MSVENVMCSINLWIHVNDRKQKQLKIEKKIFKQAV